MTKLTEKATLIPTTSGIYIIKHIPSNKIYIGSANNFKLRFIKHRRLLRANCHHSSHLQNAYNKYKEEDFSFDILEETSDLVNREQYYLDLYTPYDNSIGYNISPTAYNNTGIVRSDTYKRNKADVHAKQWFIVEAPDGTITRTRVLRYFEIYDDKGNKLSELRVKEALYRLATGKSIETTYFGWKCQFENIEKQNTANKIREFNRVKKKETDKKAVDRLTEIKLCQWKLIHADGTVEVLVGLKEIETKYKLTNLSRAAKYGYSCGGFRIEKLN